MRGCLQYSCSSSLTNRLEEAGIDAGLSVIFLQLRLDTSSREKQQQVSNGLHSVEAHRAYDERTLQTLEVNATSIQKHQHTLTHQTTRTKVFHSHPCVVVTLVVWVMNACIRSNLSAFNTSLLIVLRTITPYSSWIPFFAFIRHFHTLIGQYLRTRLSTPTPDC